MKEWQWLNVAAVGTWIVCAFYPISVMTAPLTWWPDGAAIAAYLVYGVALTAMLALRQPPHGWCGPCVAYILALIQSVTGLLVNYISAVYLGGTGVGLGLLVIVAAELPFFMAPAGVWAWVVAQALIMGLMFLPIQTGSWVGILSFAATSAAFQLFAATCSMLLQREQHGREQLGIVNAELMSTRAQLAETSRASERLRISRDLHDMLGHHLTALSLQLDVASRITAGKAAEHVAQAHAIARLLLADVRDVVGSLRDGRTDVTSAIRAMVQEATGMTIHLELPAGLTVGERTRAETLIRCIQEVITNAAKHSQAQNLWIQLSTRADGVAIDAHDDGRGAGPIELGHGLTGMRERFAQHAGQVDFQCGPDGGFRVRGFLPLPADA